MSDSLFLQLKNLIDGCDTMEELEGNISEIHDVAVARSYITSYACYRAGRIGKYGGIKRVAKALGITEKVASFYNNTWRRYRSVILSGNKIRYPRLSFSFFHHLYMYGIDKETGAKMIAEADDENIRISGFDRMIKESKE